MGRTAEVDEAERRPTDDDEQEKPGEGFFIH